MIKKITISILVAFFISSITILCQSQTKKNYSNYEYLKDILKNSQNNPILKNANLLNNLITGVDTDLYLLTNKIKNLDEVKVALKDKENKSDATVNTALERNYITAYQTKLIEELQQPLKSLLSYLETLFNLVVNPSGIAWQDQRDIQENISFITNYATQLAEVKNKKKENNKKDLEGEIDTLLEAYIKKLNDSGLYTNTWSQLKSEWVEKTSKQIIQDIDKKEANRSKEIASEVQRKNAKAEQEAEKKKQEKAAAEKKAEDEKNKKAAEAKKIAEQKKNEEEIQKAKEKAAAEKKAAEELERKKQENQKSAGKTIEQAAQQAIQKIKQLGVKGTMVADKNVALEIWNKAPKKGKARTMLISIGSENDFPSLNANKIEPLSPDEKKQLMTGKNWGKINLILIKESNPEKLTLYAFVPGKTVYVRRADDQEKFGPQTGAGIFTKTTESGLSLKNNVTDKDMVIIPISLK